MLSHNALVVVADGHTAILYRNRAKRGLELDETRRLTQQDFTEAVILESSTLEADEAAFAHGLTEFLNNLVLRQKVDELAIIADPSTLGEMRKKYHKELQQRLKKEVTKTLTGADKAAVQNALA